MDEVLRLPISTWRYHWDAPHVRHLGPMAQDWHAAFRLGDNNLTISATDTNGVALVCIQALYQRIEKLTAQVEELQSKIDRTDPPTATPPSASY